MRLAFRDWCLKDANRNRITARLKGGARELDWFLGEIEAWYRKTTTLRACSAPSLLDAIVKCAGWGIPMGNESAIIKARRLPDGTFEAVALMHYRAEMALLRERGFVRWIEAKCVYEKEPFHVSAGTEKFIKHEPILEIRKRGPLIGGYAWSETARRHRCIVTLDRADIDQIRIDHSDDWADGELDDIARWYVPKTCIHNLRREIGLPGEYLVQFSDDYDRRAPVPVVESSPAPALPPEEDVWSAMQDAQTGAAA